MKHRYLHSASLVAAALLLACRPSGARRAELAADTNDYTAMLQQARARDATAALAVEIGEAVRRFQTDVGRLPRTLDELVVRRYLTRIPSPPAGYQLRYDARLGNVGLVEEPLAPGVTRPSEAALQDAPLDLRLDR